MKKRPRVPKELEKVSTSSTRPRARRLAPEERRAQIVQSAIRVFARRGIGHTNHSEVAAEAGISLPAIFVYFPTHEGLAVCVLEEVSRFLLNDVIRPLHRLPMPVVGIVEKTYMAFLDAIDRRADHVRIWLDWSTAVRDATWPGYLAFHEAVCAVFRQSIERGKAQGELRGDLDTHATALVLVAIGHMIVQMRLVKTPRETIISTLNTLVERYLGSVLPPSRTPNTAAKAVSRKSAARV